LLSLLDEEEFASFPYFEACMLFNRHIVAAEQKVAQTAPDRFLVVHGILTALGDEKGYLQTEALKEANVQSSLIELALAWMAVSKLAPQPVAFYAGVFFLVNATYIALIWELLPRTPVMGVSKKQRKTMYFRAITTLGVFAAAAAVALKYPLLGLGMCICCLVVYLKPEAPGAEA